MKTVALHPAARVTLELWLLRRRRRVAGVGRLLGRASVSVSTAARLSRLSRG